MSDNEDEDVEYEEIEVEEEVEVEEEEEEEEEQEEQEYDVDGDVISMSQNDDYHESSGISGNGRTSSSSSSSSDAGGGLSFTKDANQVKLFYGATSVFVYPAIDNVRFALDCRTLDPKHAEVLKISKPESTSLVLSIQFGPGYLASKSHPTVRSVYNPSSNNNTPVTSPSHAAIAATASTTPTSSPSNANSNNLMTTEKLALAEQIENIARKYVENKWRSMHGTNSSAAPLDQLLAQGYEKKYCMLALEKNGDNTQKASEWLADNIKRLRKQSAAAMANSPPSGGSSSSVVGAFKNFMGINKKSSSSAVDPSNVTGAMLRDLVKKGQVQYAYALAIDKYKKIEKAVEVMMDAGIANESLATLLNECGEASISKNFVLELMTYLILRLRTCVGACMICDENVLVAHDAHIDNQPIICTKGTCQFNYQELGVCRSVPVTICPTTISEDIMHNPNVVEFVVFFFLYFDF